MRRDVKFLVLPCVFAFLGVLVSLTVQANAGDKDKDKDTGPTPVLKGFDPVLLSKGKEVAGDKDLALVHRGFRYRFSTSENRKLFEREPSKYEIQLNGMCAAMQEAEGNPDLFAVHKGLIYIFGTQKCRTNFTADPEKYLKGANLKDSKK